MKKTTKNVKEEIVPLEAYRKKILLEEPQNFEATICKHADTTICEILQTLKKTAKSVEEGTDPWSKQLEAYRKLYLEEEPKESLQTIE